MLIYVPKLTNRIGYTLNVVFHYVLKVDYTITVDHVFFEQSDEPKFCYATEPVDDAPFLAAAPLLHTVSVEAQTLNASTHAGVTTLFSVDDPRSILPFDALAAVFFMVSRYEEYLPHRIDSFGRFPASESVAFTQGFLDVPVVDLWAAMLYRAIQQHYPQLPDLNRHPSFVATVDIDAAFCYRNKGVLRTLMGLAKDKLNHDLFRERMATLLGRKDDPFDTFDFLLEQQKIHPDVKFVFFPLLGDYDQYDKPISYANKEFRDLLQHIGDYAKMGIHSSFRSSDAPQLIHVETERLANILHRPIVRNRCHYLRLNIPQTYHSLIAEGIHHDYSMGYADEPGYRAGTATPYPCYDIERDEELPILSHPFCLMDTTLIVHKKMLPGQAEETFARFLDASRQAGTDFCAIWHNQNICDNDEYRPWRQIFVRVLDRWKC